MPASLKHWVGAALYNLHVPFHVVINMRNPDRGVREVLAVDKDEAWVQEKIVRPRRLGVDLFVEGEVFTWADVARIRITETPQLASILVRERRLELMRLGSAESDMDGLAYRAAVVREAGDVTDRFLDGPPGAGIGPKRPPCTGRVSNRKAVMVIYGHDTDANNALFDWLRAIGLQPREWSQLIHASGTASPYIGQVLDKAFEEVQAVVAFLTPDERVTSAVRPGSGSWRLQARPNVLIEAGMALVTHPDRTVLVVHGNQEIPSDLAGRHYVRLSHTEARPLHELARRLTDAGCDTELTGTDWLNPARFPDRTRAPAGSEQAGTAKPETSPPSPREDEAAPAQSSIKPGPVITSAWLNLNDGGQYPALMETGRYSISHPGYRHDESSPSVQVAALVPCPPPPAALATSQIRACFLSLLNGRTVKAFLSAVTSPPGNVAWMSWGDRPRGYFGAILHGDDQELPPIAWARLVLPQDGQSAYGRTPGSAQLIVHAFPRAQDGRPASPATLAGWHDRFAHIADLPGALAGFITLQLGLASTDRPPAQIGVCLNADAGITQLVDSSQLRTIPGSSPGTWFRGWAVADRDGTAPQDLIHDWLTQMCDAALHVSDYEPLLQSLRTAEA